MNRNQGCVDDEMRDEMLAYHKNGVSQADIGVILGVGQSTVGYWLMRSGDPSFKPAKPKLSQDAVARLVMRFKEGVSPDEIMEEFGVHRSTVWYHIHKNEVI